MSLTLSTTSELLSFMTQSRGEALDAVHAVLDSQVADLLRFPCSRPLLNSNLLTSWLPEAEGDKAVAEPVKQDGRCGAKTLEGSQCKRKAGPDGLCHQHDRCAAMTDKNRRCSRSAHGASLCWQHKAIWLAPRA